MDLIDRNAAIRQCQKRLYETALNNVGYECNADEVYADIAQNRIKIWLNELPSSARTEPLTDKEKRIFLSAIERETRVCKGIDEKYGREPYEGSLTEICREIERKVRGAFWI